MKITFRAATVRAVAGIVLLACLGALATAAYSPQGRSSAARSAINSVRPACVQILGTARHQQRKADTKSLRGEPLADRGSGVIIEASAGLVLTNHHVIDTLDEIVVRLHDGKEVAAQLLGSNEQADVAVLRISANNLQAVSLASPDAVHMGDPVIAMGSPKGLPIYASQGSVGSLRVQGSAVLPDNRAQYIAHDATMLPGSSGGPLVNMEGKLLGINTAVLSEHGVTISLAVPAEDAMLVAEAVLRHGKLPPGRHGLLLRDAPQSSLLGRVDRAREAVIIEGVEPASAADRGGVRPGMIVHSINASKVRSATDLELRLALVAPGEQVTLSVDYRGQSSELTFTLD